MAQSDLGIQNKKGHTALSFAAATGNVQIAKLMVGKNSQLPSIKGPEAKSPLYFAALSGHSDMAEYLFNQIELLGTPENQIELLGTPAKQIELLNTCISAGLYGLALKIVEHHEELAVARDKNGETPLHVLAQTPLAFAGGIQQGMWGRIINSFPYCKGAQKEMLMQTKALELLKFLWSHVIGQPDLEISQMITTNVVQLLFVAAELGNYNFLVELLRFYPDFIWKVDKNRQSIFHIAVKHRHENIFNLIYEIGTVKELIATYRDNGDDNNMLHLAASIAPPNQLNVVSGAALQMQRQLIWYKAVEKIVPPSYREMKNQNGKTPHNLFIANHKELMKEGEQWMKGTAKSCMLVATLIATVAYTTAFTVPGGNDNSTGAPILLNKRFFTVFSVSEAVSMLSSSTSILMFLSILTSRYAEHDFLVSLPIWLMIGFTTLFVSVAAMMIAFCTTFVLSYHQGLAQVLVPFSLFAFVPIVFISLNYSLLFDIIRSTFGTRFLFRSRKRLFS
uniref:PGG domain-containing protein n=1 Tax=Davidia involucrata TaxID=16924 RepID=A0A5B7AIQ9_DAVIN